MAVAQDNDKSEVAQASSAAARLAARRAAKAAAKAAKRGTAPIMPSRMARGVIAARGFLEQHRRRLAIGLGVAVVASAGAFAVSAQWGKQGREATELLATAVNTANAPIVAAGEEPPGPGPAPDESYPTEKARAQKALDEFRSVSKRFPDTDATAWARLGAAQQLAALAKPADAEKLYAEVASQANDRPFVRWRALEGAGFALEAQQKYADAEKRFKDIASIENGAFKPASDYHVARMLIAQGQKQKAAELLQALVKAERARPPGEGTRFESLVADAETLLNELSVELDAPKLRTESPANSGLAPHPGPASGTPALTQDIVDALRKQLAAGKGGKGLTKDIVDELDRQVKSGEGGNVKSVRVPAPKAPGSSK